MFIDSVSILLNVFIFVKVWSVFLKNFVCWFLVDNVMIEFFVLFIGVELVVLVGWELKINFFRLW